MASSPSFTATVSAITDAFGDPTRRGSTCSPATTIAPGASRRCRSTRCHRLDGRRRGRRAPNVARHHLDKLAAGGYLEVGRRPCRAAPGRPPVEALRRVADASIRVDSRCAATISCCRCSGGRSTCSRSDEAEAMAEQVGQEYGRAMAAGLTGDALAAGQRIAALGDAGGGRRAHGARVRRPRRGPQRPAADHQQPLPVRRGGHRAPGDLRRRPRHGQGHARRARSRRRRLGDVTTESASPAATRSAPPPSDVACQAPRAARGFADQCRAEPDRFSGGAGRTR